MVASSHIPVRACVGCRERFPQQELLRLRVHKGSVVIVRNSIPAEGRSIYLCPRESCWERAFKGGRLVFKSGKYDKAVVMLDSRERELLLIRLKRCCRELAETR